MTRSRRAVKAASPKPVKVGDAVPVQGNGFAVLPDGGSVSARVSYVIRHKGLHIVDGVEYLAS